MFSRRQAIGFAFLFCGCAGHKPPVLEDHFPSGRLSYHIEVDTGGRKQGHEVWWYDNGSRKYEAINEQGVRNGVFQAWNPDGSQWYRGKEEHGVAEDSLIYWYPNGKIQTVAVFHHGVQTGYQSFDSTAKTWTDTLVERNRKDSLSALKDRLRREGITDWSRHVRTTVESYWSVPKDMAKNSYRSAALIRIDRMGNLRSVGWTEKSPSQPFNNLAVKALKKVKRFPPFPPEVPDATLEIQYEFVTSKKIGWQLKLTRIKNNPPGCCANCDTLCVPPSAQPDRPLPSKRR